MPEAARTQITLGLGIVLALFVSALLFLRTCLGGGVGDLCGQSGGCQFGLTCIRGKCLPKCQEDSDCPDGMRCGILQFPGSEFEDRTSQVLVCLARDEAEREVQQAIVPGDNRMTALSRKRSETYDAIQRLLQVEKDWKLSDEQFEAGWDRVPEDVRASKSVEDLAKLILMTGGSPVP